ncbi:MAG: response regulator [Actinomycetia bacterium]|nr:response regulator [Actinomycetes bacterium]MCP4958074.1 response regulator [Actinomycetes bacterium]
MIRPGKAIVVDDSRAMRLLIGRALRNLGFTSFEAADGFEALHLLEVEGDISVMLVDWNMPTMSGLHLIRRVRDQKRWGEVPIMMVTSETDPDRVTEALEAGADEYLTKPFDSSMLSGKLELMGFKIPRDQTYVVI